MKILNDSQNEIKKDRVEAVQEQEQGTRIEFDSRIVPHRGHTVFKINNETLEINVAEYEDVDIVFDASFTRGRLLNVERKIIKKEGYSYVSALNKKNALKNFKRGFNGSSIDYGKECLGLI